MINQEISQIFERIADFLEMEKIDFRSRAYRKAARFLDSLNQDVLEIYQESGLKGLEDLPGIGASLAEKIEEYIKTGKIKAYTRFKKRCPVDLESLTKVEGLGPRKIKVLYDRLKIKDLKDLEKAVKAKEIRKLAGFGPKSEENIQKGLEFAKADRGRLLLGAALPLAREIVSHLGTLKEIGRIGLAGSLRRYKETIGDIDILATSEKPEKVMDFFVALPWVEKVWSKGPTRSSVRLRQGLDCDLRVVKPESFGSALQYFTGSKEHNIALRRIALKKKLKLNEYGLFAIKKKQEERLAGKTEAEIYRILGLSCPEPEIRMNEGEIEAGLKNQLPNLIKYGEIRGDCHCHTNWSDGLASVEQMAQAACDLGYEYLAITDHTRDLKMAGGLGEDRLLRQAEEIDRVNSKFKTIKLLKGCEVNIKENGDLDIGDKVLSQMDIVVASIHSQMKLSLDRMTQRIIKVMENENVDIIGHPTGRVLLRREPYVLEFDEILAAAKRTKTALEINAHPERLDLGYKQIRQAREQGVGLVINTDAHTSSGLMAMEFGVSQARRGWAEGKDILNTLPLKKFLAALK